ncbi:hypothetical protein IAU60_002207 [Kwoniella sp. DSM 27419]
MPRIPVRTTPYHALPRCTRHYKSKRDLILRSLGKASFINGSQYVITWISPKGDIDTFASELLQGAVNQKDGGGVLNKKELEKEAQRIKSEMARRWDQIRRTEEKGEGLPLDDDAADDDADENDDCDEIDPDRTLVDDEPLATPLKASSSSSQSVSSLKRPSPAGYYSTLDATRSSTPATPMQVITLKPSEIETFYMDRFTNLQQQTCKLVVKAWIKIIEPKKQMKYPYNKGEETKPSWWPQGVKHREPDHLPKDERKILLMSIVRHPSVSVARLQLSTAETSALISATKIAILREIYIVAQEEEKMRAAGDSVSSITVELPIVTPAAQSPEPITGKRTSSAYLSDQRDMYDAGVPGFAAHAAQKRLKTMGRLPTLPLPAQGQTPYDAFSASASPFGYAQPQPQHPSQHLTGHVWRDSPTHLSPYPYATSDVHSEYSRSPNPDAEEHHQQSQQHQQHQPSQPQRTFQQHHLAPILNSHGATPSPIESPGFAHPGGMQAPASAGPGYFPRTFSSMQQAQHEHLAQHQLYQAQPQPTETYGFQSPYVTEQTWEGSYSQTA